MQICLKKKYTTAGGGGGDKYELCVSICKLVIVQLATLRAGCLSAQTLTKTKTKLLRKNPFSKLVNSSFNCKYWISKQITFMVQWRNQESKLFFSRKKDAEGCNFSPILSMFWDISRYLILEYITWIFSLQEAWWTICLLPVAPETHLYHRLELLRLPFEKYSLLKFIY